jgi:hypothetical protein
MEVPVRSQISPCESCGGESDIGTGFSPSTPVFHVTIIPSQFHICLCLLRVAFIEGQMDLAREHSKKK